MAWSTSDRRSRLPKDWPKRRNHILKRDGRRCTWILSDGSRCNAPATDVDHIIPGDDHSDGNLRSLCSDHHKRKSSGEGAAALWKKRKEISQRFRRTETHPGLIPIRR